MRVDSFLKDSCYAVQALDEDGELAKDQCTAENGYSGKYRDNLIGQFLRDCLVKAAREKELQFFDSKKVWRKVAKGRAKLMTGREPIRTRWSDVNKGEDFVANIRSRIVAASSGRPTRPGRATSRRLLPSKLSGRSSAWQCRR